MPKHKWENALELAVAAVHGGAAPWRIQPAAAKELRNKHYRDGFREAYEKTPQNWDTQGQKVLRMARCAGMLAALLAEWDGKDPLNDHVTIDHLLAAMAFVMPGCRARRTRGLRAGRPPMGVLGQPCNKTRPTEAAKELLRNVWKEIDTSAAAPKPLRRRPR